MNGRKLDEQALLDALARLPREMEPPRDGWDAIDAQLDQVDASPARAGFGRVSLAAAAALLVAFAAGLMLGRGGDRASAPEPAWAPPPMQAALAASERQYQAAFREFIPVGQARETLADGTLVAIEDAWQALQHEESELRAALEEYPDHPMLGHALLSLRERQVDFLKHMADLDRVTWRTS